MRNLVLLFFLVYSLHATSQTSTYHPFPESNATWCSEEFGGGGPCVYINKIYRLDGDSVINGVLYQRLSHYEYKETRDCISNQMTFYTDNSDTYYIRQDTSLKKIWIRDPYTSQHQDTLMYDFNLLVGDTISRLNTFWGDNCFNCIVTSIDSVLIGNDYRKRFNYHSSCPGYNPSDTSMVEGIGGMHGLLSPPSCFESASWLKEFSQNSTVLYTNSIAPFHYQGCQAFVNVTEINSTIKSKIYPNPFSDQATLEIRELYGSDLLLNIFNSIGKLVRSEIISQAITTMDKEELKSGLYFFHLINEKGELGTGKFIIE